MDWSSSHLSWRELERTLSDPRRPEEPLPPGADGGESPAWSRKRKPYVPPPSTKVTATVPYAELHAHSNYSFLDGASPPEELVEEAARLGLSGIAITDHDGFYGVVRIAEAAESFAPMLTVYGAELSLGLDRPQNGEADPGGSHLLVLARGQEGYHRLSGVITDAHLAEGAEKGHPIYDLETLASKAGGYFVVLTGCRKGAVRQALRSQGEPAAAHEVDRLVELFGHENVVVELLDNGEPLASDHNDALWRIAQQRGLAVVATGNVHYARPEQRNLASAVAAVRARRSLDDLDGWLPSGGSHLRSGAEMAARFARYPGAIEHTVVLAKRLSFALRKMKPALPSQDVPDGHTPMSWLRTLVWDAVPEKYPRAGKKERERIERELRVIEDKNFPGYFLIVHEIVTFAKGKGILCQGRGSAANSAVCYLLGITAVDAIAYDLPFERFLSSMRDEEPDIDVDFDSDRREEVIQHVFTKYGRQRAAQVANVITYRPKAAVRDMAKALGYSGGQQDAWSKRIETWGSVNTTEEGIPGPVIGLANELMRFPRHLGIHSGGMVLTERPVGEVVPIEHARMENRTVVQWDKDDCASMGLVKFDLLGLGMLAAIQYCFDLVKKSTGEEWTLATLPKEEKGVYDMLGRADAVGVFQVESRAQLNTLPRLQPRTFHELAIEIALIRPGPIQGGAVHPYIRRKLGKEKVTYLHPSLEPVLKRTMGVPLFQEQLMQIAVMVGECTPEQADLLRRSMGSKRGIERIETIRDQLYAGMKRNGIDESTADKIYSQIQAFAGFGFAESHAISFAFLVYASSWLKLHYPGVFLAALLRAQPMGFYSPATLTADARRHGVRVLRPDIQASGVEAGLELSDKDVAPGVDACLATDQPPVGLFDPELADTTAAHRRDGAHAVRLGLAAVAGIGAALATRIVEERATHGEFHDLAELVHRTGLTAAQLESLATAGAFDSFGLTRRQAIWDAGNAAQNRAEFLPGTMVSVQPPLFPLLTPVEQVAADLWATGISTDDHPVRHVRESLAERGVLSAVGLATAEADRRVEVAGVVIHRQRPSSADGVTFLNLEDETGLINIICTTGVWKRHRRVARESAALIVRGMLERSPEGVVSVLADHFETLSIVGKTVSRDFH